MNEHRRRTSGGGRPSSNGAANVNDRLDFTSFQIIFPLKIPHSKTKKKHSLKYTHTQTQQTDTVLKALMLFDEDRIVGVGLATTATTVGQCCAFRAFQI